MIRIWACSIALLTSTAARADPDRYVELGAAAGGFGPGGFGLYGLLAVSVPTSANGSVRVAVVGGAAGTSEYAGGQFAQVRVGYEARPCSRVVCAAYGVDLAPFYARYYGDGVGFDAVGVMAILRSGFDVGSARVRFRLGFEGGVGVYGAFDGHSSHHGAFDLAITTGVAVRW